MALLWKERERFPSAVPVLVVHDELVVECDEDDGPAVKEWVSDVLQRGMGEYVERVRISVKTEVAKTWAG